MDYLVGGIFGVALVFSFVYLIGRLVSRFCNLLWYGNCTPGKPSRNNAGGSGGF